MYKFNFLVVKKYSAGIRFQFNVNNLNLKCAFCNETYERII